MTEQEKEIKTIKERTINVKISDADVERLSTKVGMVGITVSELFENFIGDLVCGTYTNGSDERDKANDWFERCGFSWNNDNTLLKHLLEWGNDVDEFLTTYDELKYYETNPEEFADEVTELEKGEKLWFQSDYENYIEEYLEKNQDVDIEKEVEICRKWLKDMQKLKGE